MKKCLSSILVLLLLASPVCASADLIYIQMNPFFKQHEWECDPYEAIYEAVKDTFFYEEPGVKKETESIGIKAGETKRISHKFGSRWGLLDWDDMWIDLDDFRRLYDQNDFYRAHRKECLETYGILMLDKDAPYIEWIMVPEEISEFTVGQRVSGEYSVVLWAFPGSDRISSKFLHANNLSIEFDTVYRDEAGNLWLHIEGYLHGNTEGWLYLNNFSGTEPPFVTAHYADEAKDDSAPLPAGLIGPQGPGGTQPPLLPLAAALLISAAAAALLLFMKPKKKPAEAV